MAHPAPAAVQNARYFPPAGAWEKRDPAAVGLDKAKLDEAIKFAIANENTNTKDLAVDIPNSFRSEAPYNNLIGPTQPRTGANGVIIRNGYLVAEWGDTARADMTFSVTKTFVSTVAGLAHDRGLIKSVHDKVAGYMPKGVDLFTSEHNAKITWDHLLRQTSDWYGELWGKPDWADRPARGVADRRVAQARAQRARDVLQVQRHARERARAGDAAPDEEAAARRDQDVDHGSDRRLEHLALGGLRQRVGDDRRRRR